MTERVRLEQLGHRPPSRVRYDGCTTNTRRDPASVFVNTSRIARVQLLQLPELLRPEDPGAVPPDQGESGPEANPHLQEVETVYF